MANNLAHSFETFQVICPIVIQNSCNPFQFSSLKIDELNALSPSASPSVPQPHQKKPTPPPPPPQPAFSCFSKKEDKSKAPLTPELTGNPISEYSSENSLFLLPPKIESDKNKISLVLDVDETLIHATVDAHCPPNGGAEEDEELIINAVINVNVRPFCREFIKQLASLYELIVFTAATKGYADLVLDKIDPDRLIKYRLYRESCLSLGNAKVKDLSRLGRELEKVIIIDNTSTSYILQPYNAIGITSWYDNPSDNELKLIGNILSKCYRLTNVYGVLADI